MKTLVILIATILLTAYGHIFSQNIILTLNGDNNGQPVNPDSILIRDISKGTDTVLYYPDHVLHIVNVNIDNPLSGDHFFSVSQNRPNPADVLTFVDLYVPGRGEVIFSVFDVMGRLLTVQAGILDRGEHTVRFYPGSEKFYFLNVSWSGQSSAIKIFNPEPDPDLCRLEL
ncbi:MAG: T9SS type A sorting domain-containing protein, partial [Bacteroidales bacterium]|nr:T9SS type A sorting domain-containing protein [Bacteroidales bacterium]